MTLTSHLETLQLLLFVISIAAMLTARLRLPYSIGLVLVGCGLAMFPFVSDIHVTRDLIYTILLPPLIFEAALFLPQRTLRREFPLILSMATIGVVVAALVMTIGMHEVLGWSWLSAAIFGALISATDPVSVIAVFKENQVNERLRLLVEGESLFNDGTAAVMFALLLSVAGGANLSVGSVCLHLLAMIVGSVLCGMGVTVVMLFLIGKTADHLIEITFTTLTAYGAFLVAEHCHFSGVLATLTAGLIMGHPRVRQLISEKGRETVIAFWEYLAFISNSFVFLLIGIREMQQPVQQYALMSLVAIAILFVSRIVTIYPMGWLFAKTRLRMSLAYQHILVWGGLRGALALALALGLPDELPYRDEITAVAFVVVAFSIVVQGMTIKPLLKKLGELQQKST